MKTGDLKKQEILQTAEARFCRFGYEATSIQNILDDLHTSKGSFYHHFASKEVLLEAICRNRAENTSIQIIGSISPDASATERLNTLLSGMIPFSGEKLSFLLMILPVFTGPESVPLKNGYMNELSGLYIQPVSDTLKKGTEEGTFSCSDPVFSAGLCLFTVHRYWMAVCDRILMDSRQGIRTDPSELLSLTEQYRTAVERILAAPFGSITLIRLPELKNLTEQIQQHLQPA